MIHSLLDSQKILQMILRSSIGAADVNGAPDPLEHPDVTPMHADVGTSAVAASGPGSNPAGTQFYPSVFISLCNRRRNTSGLVYLLQAPGVACIVPTVV